MELSKEQIVICFGEVLWDILPKEAFPGGAPMNVAFHLKKLGATPVVLSKVGLDNYGERLVDFLSSNGINTEYLNADSKYETGLVYAKVDANQEVKYDIVYPSAWDFIEWKLNYTTLLDQSNFFVYGSLSSRNSTSRDTLYQLLELAHTKVLDINLRAPHYDQARVKYLLQKADILKMNKMELELISSWFSHFHSLEDQIKVLQDRFTIPIIIVTKGGEGAMINDKGKVYQHNGFNVAVADTIGSGDAFLAGFINELMQGSTIENALGFASAIGAFVASCHGACPDYQIAQILEMKNTQANLQWSLNT